MAKPVDECRSVAEVLEHSLTAFGGAILHRIHRILHEAIENRVPLVVSIAGPITLSDQHRGWLIPMIVRGWIAYVTVTDAICYHDGHDCLRQFSERPIGEVDPAGDDSTYHKAGIIRVADTGFPEEILFEQDRLISAILQQPEFQKPMTTTERNSLLGKYYAAREETFGVRPGLLSTCYRHGVPVFIGAPADGSAFLNSVKLWALDKIGACSHRFEYDLHADVFEACAYHYWGLFNSDAKALAALILGGGVPKNYSLQPEPTLSQIFRLPNIRGYDYDVQIVSSPATDGSLSSCPPAEAVTWGKVNPDTYQQKTASLQADYSLVMPFIAAALLAKLPPQPQLRLYNQREQLTARLMAAIQENLPTITPTLNWPQEV